ncbi:MAG TPA: autotransporter-associated beta strand repeat-containing protein, partial [Prosthecobacter sp.]|nr:autotransporter-associated beta strand repeat-containing protein [Prosthecobacter sp.]
SVNGVLRPLAAGEFTDGSIVANNNIVLNGAAPTVSVNTTINSLTLGAGGGVSMTPATTTLTVDSGGILALASNSGINGGLLSTSSNREMIIHAIGNLTISSTLARFTGGMTKSGEGVLTLSSSNYFTGTTTLNEGTLKLAGGNNTLFYNNVLTLQGGLLDLNGYNQFFNTLQTSTSTPNNANLVPDAGGKVINTGATQSTLAIGTGASFAATIGNGNPAQSNIAVVRSTAAGGSSDWNPYSPNTFTGPLILNGGRVNMLGTSTFSNTSSIELSQSTLLISNNNATSIADVNLNDRINDNAPILMRGAMLQPRGRFGELTTEIFGDLTLGEGTSIIDVAAGGTGVNELTVTFASLERQAGSHATLRLLNVGGVIGSAAQMFITDAPVLSNNLIGGWATVEREFASYTTATGVGALNTAGYAGYSGKLINDAVASDNIRIALPTAGLLTTLTGNRTMNSLNVNAPSSTTGNSTLDLGGNILTLASGGLILSPITDGFNMIVQNGSLTAGTLNTGGDLYLHAMSWFNGQGDNTGNRDVLVNANIVDNGTGPVTLVIAGSQGRGTAAATNDVFISGSNTYTGGTFVNSGRIVLNNLLANGTTITATGTGNLTITGGYGSNPGSFTDRNTQVILNASNQIANTATVKIMGGATLNLNNFNQTVAGIDFNNHGGDSPTLAIGNGILNLGGNITAVSANLGSVATISTSALGRVNLNGATRTLTVDRVTANGQNLAPLLASLNISGVISGTGSEGLIKNGTGLLQLGGQNTFSGGINLQAGGITIAASSTPTQGGLPITSGPLGTGALSVANGALIVVDNSSRTVANNVSFAGNPIFESTGVSAITLQFNGLTTLPDGAVVVSIANPNLTVALMGAISNMASITSITRSGLGNLLFNSTGYTGDFVITSSNLLSITNDGDGTGSVQTLMMGSATFDAGLVPSITVGRVGLGLPLVQAANKIISLASVNSISNGLIVTANNGYGLQVNNAATLASPTFNVTPATNSNVVQGLYLAGTLSGTGFVKTGLGTVVLENT